MLGTLIRIPQLWHGLNEMYAWRQTHVTYVALEYARHGINLMHSPLPIYGPNADVPWEFPLFQAAAAMLIRLGVAADSAMRIIGLLGFQATAILLAVLVLRWHGQLAAIVVMALFQFVPFALAWGAAALIDFPSVALSLGMVVGLDAWFRTGSRTGLLLGAVSGWLAFLVKATTPPPWCVLILVSAATAYLGARSWGRIITGFLAGPIIGAAAGAVWGLYAKAIRDRNPLTQGLVPKDLNDWIFGTLNQRLDARAYTPILARVGLEIAGPLWLGLVLAVLGIVLAPTKVERFRRAGWLATAVSAPLVFLTLYHIHEYYLIGIFPAIVAAVGVGIVAVAQRIPRRTTLVAVAATVLAVVGSAIPLPWNATIPIIFWVKGVAHVSAQTRPSLFGWNDVRQWLASPQPDLNGVEIRAVTRPDDLIVLVGYNQFGPNTLYFADRRGLMLPDNNLDIWKRENINDYHYLYTCDPALPLTTYLPAGYEVIPTREPHLWRIAPRPG